jgi:hypothetical protein
VIRKDAEDDRHSDEVLENSSPADTAARGRPFEAGTSGNPRGRPKGSRNKATLAIEALLEGEMESLTRTLIEKAKQGDMGALRLCIDRVLPARRDRTVSFDLPEIESSGDAVKAAAAVMRACAAGELSPHEALTIMELVDKWVRALELCEIDKRLTTLEKAAGGES